MFQRTSFTDRLLVLAAVLFAGIAPGAAVAAEPEPAVVGLLAELTGPFSSNGEDCRRGFEVARSLFAPGDRAGRRPLRFMYADSQGDAKTALSEFRRMAVSERPSGVILTRSQVAMAINPLSKARNIPLLGSVGYDAFIRDNPFAFRFFPNCEAEGRALARRAAAGKPPRYAVITVEDEYNMALSAQFIRHLDELGGILLHHETVRGEESGFSSLLQRTKQLQPDALFVNLGIHSAGMLFRRMHELEFKTTVLSNFWTGKQEVIDAAGSAAVEGVIFVETDLDQPKLRAALEERFGHPEATAVTFACYSGLAALIEALKNPGGASGAETAAALQSVNAVPLADGKLPLVEREAQIPLVYRTVRRGKVVDAAEEIAP